VSRSLTSDPATVPASSSPGRLQTSGPPAGRAESSAGERPPGEPRRVGYLYAAPALLFFAAFVLVPLGRAAYLSLFEWDGLTDPQWVGLDNYADVVSDPELRSAFGHAAILLIFYSVLPICLGLLLAGIVARTRVRGLALFRTILFLPQVIALVVVAAMWKMIYDPANGPLNRGLRAIGLESLEQNWLGGFDVALPSVGLIGTWVMYGLAMILFMAGVQKIPPSLYDAARVDGAGPFSEFFAVTLPGLRGELAVALTLTTIAALRNFDIVYITTAGGPGSATTVPAFQVYQRVFEFPRVGSAAAVGMVLLATIFALALVINRVADRGMAR
jgi:raffinose/stachyose/melibiose transport system permease protein